MPTPTVLQVALAATKVYNADPFASEIPGFGRPQARFFDQEQKPEIAIWMNDDDVILSFRGSVYGKDWTLNNSKFVINSFPARFPISLEWGNNALFIAGRTKRVIITGHSLGGGLAQLVGYYLDVPFLTFNAPPVRNFLNDKVWLKPKGLSSRSPTRDFDKGFNFRVKHDPVSHLPGKHIGSIINLTPSRWLETPHIGANVIAALERTEYARKRYGALLVGA